ncbi:hypothetical protein HQ531_02265 [bacterium]|nr:hypothetical protein [bacterium]
MKADIKVPNTFDDGAMILTFNEFSTYLANWIPEVMLQELYMSVLPSISDWGIEEEVTAWIKSQIINDQRLYAFSENDTDELMIIIESVFISGWKNDSLNPAHIRALRSRVVESLQHDLTKRERDILEASPNGIELELILKSKRNWIIWEIINQHTCPSIEIIDPLEPFRWLAHQYTKFDIAVSG